jgi:hypothetical protein
MLDLVQKLKSVHEQHVCAAISLFTICGGRSNEIQDT